MSEPSRVKTLLETATNISVLLVSLLIISAFAWGFFAKKQGTAPLQVGLQRGAKLAPLPGFNYKDSSKTLLIAMSTRCAYCSESVPFYKQITEAKYAHAQLRTAAVFPDSSDEVKQYAQQKQLNAELISGVDLSSLDVSGTPTLILVDSNGTVLNFWVGRLSEEGEQEVLKAVNASDV
jgi:thioredoxin-related protein